MSLSILCHTNKNWRKQQKNQNVDFQNVNDLTLKKKLWKLFFFKSNFYCSLLVSITSCSEFHKHLKPSLSKKKEVQVSLKIGWIASLKQWSLYREIKKKKKQMKKKHPVIRFVFVSCLQVLTGYFVRLLLVGKSHWQHTWFYLIFNIFRSMVVWGTV